MTELPASGVLQQKARQGARKRDAEQVSPTRALRLALARAADDMWKLALSVSGVQRDDLDCDEAAGVLQDDDLILVLKGPNGVAALVGMTPQVLGALIEVQTLGVVHSKPMEPRSFTPTDGAMAWLFVDAALKAFVNAQEDGTLALPFQDYRYETLADTPARAALYLDMPRYHTLSASVDFAGGARQGDLRFIFPHKPVELDPSDGDAGSATTDNGFRLLPIALEARVSAVPMSIERAMTLAPGQLLALPDNVLNTVQLSVSGGQVIAHASLGQMNGFRAVRLFGADQAMHPPAPARTEALPRKDNLDPRSAAPDEFDPASPAPTPDQDALSELAAAMQDPPSDLLSDPVAAQATPTLEEEYPLPEQG